MAGQKTVFVLIRHGEVQNPEKRIYGRLIDVPLSESGFAQVVNLAVALKHSGVSPDVIYSSPLRRATQSVCALHQVFPGIPLNLVTDLEDADHSGVADKTVVWLETAGADLYNLPEFKGKIEEPESMAARLIGALKMAEARHVGQTIFVVSHGDPLAYGVWRLRLPREPFPSRQGLKESNYLGKGQAWLTEFCRPGTINKLTLVKP